MRGMCAQVAVADEEKGNAVAWRPEKKSSAAPHLLNVAPFKAWRVLSWARRDAAVRRTNWRLFDHACTTVPFHVDVVDMMETQKRSVARCGKRYEMREAFVS